MTPGEGHSMTRWAYYDIEDELDLARIRADFDAGRYDHSTIRLTIRALIAEIERLRCILSKVEGKQGGKARLRKLWRELGRE